MREDEGPGNEAGWASGLRAATDGVVEHGRDVGIRVVDGIIRCGLAAIGIARPIAPHRQLEVGIVRARLRVIRPVPLFEHHHAHPGLEEALGRDRPGRPRANDQNV